MELTKENRAALKGQGYLTMKDPSFFSCRVVLPSCKLTAVQAQKLSEVSTAYGRGYLTTTQRGNIHIPWVAYENLTKVADDLATVGLEIGATGMRPRPAQNCKGTVCSLGLIDTEKTAALINERFYKGYYNVKLPSKVRIQVSGCPHNCAQTLLACIGLAAKKPGMVAITVGGFSGKEVQIAQELDGLYTIDQALDIVDQILAFYRDNGQPGERIGKMVKRLGQYMG